MSNHHPFIQFVTSFLANTLKRLMNVSTPRRLLRRPLFRLCITPITNEILCKSFVSVNEAYTVHGLEQNSGQKTQQVPRERSSIYKENLLIDSRHAHKPQVTFTHSTCIFCTKDLTRASHICS